MGWKDALGRERAEQGDLERRVTDLERTVRYLLEQHGVSPDDAPGPDLGEVRSLMASGRKIDAIKAYRAVTGAGLAEAKRAVEALDI